MHLVVTWLETYLLTTTPSTVCPFRIRYQQCVCRQCFYFRHRQCRYRSQDALDLLLSSWCNRSRFRRWTASPVCLDIRIRTIHRVVILAVQDTFHRHRCCVCSRRCWPFLDRHRYAAGCLSLGAYPSICLSNMTLTDALIAFPLVS